MKHKYPTADRIRELFSYDEDTGILSYRTAPYRRPAMVGKAAGRKDKRDGILYVNVDGHPFSMKAVISLYRTGELPAKPMHHTQLTVEHLRSALSYNPETGEFVRAHNHGNIKAGIRADYVENNGYRYVNLDGKRYIAGRLAWFYVNGEWPERVLRFQDDDKTNCAIANLAYGEWDFSDPAQKREYDRTHRKAHPIAYRRHDLKRDFGISLEQYQAMFVAQGGVCAICEQPEKDKRDGKRKWLAVDHDHKDGSIRGLLCSQCNNMLGRAKDSVEALRQAAEYLRAHAEKPKTNVIPLAGRRVGQS